MKTWSSIPGVTYPKAAPTRPRRTVRADEPRISSAEIAALFGCTRAHARHIGQQHGGPAARAVDPASGKSTCYYRRAPIERYYQANHTRYTTPRGVVPAGYLPRTAASAQAGSYYRLLKLVRQGHVRSISHPTAGGTLRTYYHAGDLRRCCTNR